MRPLLILTALTLAFLSANAKPFQNIREGIHKPRVHPVKLYYDKLPVIGGEVKKG